MMRGLATETMVVSIRIIKNPITRDQSAGHGLATFSMGSLGLEGELIGRADAVAGTQPSRARMSVPLEHLRGGARGGRAGVGVRAGVQQRPRHIRCSP